MACFDLKPTACLNLKPIAYLGRLRDRLRDYVCAQNRYALGRHIRSDHAQYRATTQWLGSCKYRSKVIGLNHAS